MEKKHKYATRAKEHLNVPSLRFSYLQRNSLHTLVKIYNKIPDEIKQLPQKRMERVLFNYMKDRPYYSLNEFLNT